MYVLEYRPRVYNGTAKDRAWKEAREFQSLPAAQVVLEDCKKLRRNGTNDWRVRPVS